MNTGTLDLEKGVVRCTSSLPASRNPKNYVYAITAWVFCIVLLGASFLDPDHGLTLQNSQSDNTCTLNSIAVLDNIEGEPFALHVVPRQRPASRQLLSETFTFDQVLGKLWEDRERRGVSRYPLEGIRTKRMFPSPLHQNAPVPYVFIMENVGRSSKRAQNAPVATTTPDLDLDAFNFLQVKSNEVLFTMDSDFHDDLVSPSDSDSHQFGCLDNISDKTTIQNSISASPASDSLHSAGGDKATHFESNSIEDPVAISDDDSSEPESERSSLGISLVKSDHLLLMNVNPISQHHSLFVPFYKELRPQRIDTEAMFAALQFASELTAPAFRLAYNSIGAYASVNHLHFQLWSFRGQQENGDDHDNSIDERLPIELADLTFLNALELPNNDKSEQEVANNLPDGDESTRRQTQISSEQLDLVEEEKARIHVLETTNYPIPTIVFSQPDIDDSTGSSHQSLLVLGTAVADCITELNNRNIPHNMVITNHGRRVFVWPRTFQLPDAERVSTTPIPNARPGFPSFSGMVLVTDRQDYEKSSYEDIVQEMQFYALPHEEFASIRNYCAHL